MKVRDIMTPNPRTAEPDTTLEEIATLMKQEDVGVIPVMEDNRVTGIVTDRDIVVRCIAAGKDPIECTAEDIMSEGVNTIAPDADVDDAADLMSEKQVRRLAVVDNGRLVGMLSLGDIAVKTGDEEEETTAETLEEVSKGVKGTARHASGRNAGRNAGRNEQEFDEESEVEMAGSGARQSGRDRANWNQGDREAARGGDSRRVASAERWEGGRGSNDREAGRMQQSQSGRGSQQPSVRGRSERNDRRADERPQGRNGRDDRREREEKRAGRKQAAQGVSNRNLSRENARQQKVAPKRAEARGNRNAGRKRAS
ncbi:MAG TPA: CBS domain-containing protein [Terriglobales bacterium]|nr:CBS domain-containing protein [Terriglobales bacterium]